MKRKFIIILIILIIFPVCIYADDNITYVYDISTDTNEIDLDLTTDNYILYNLNDDNIIYSKNSDEKKQIASLTKIMTAITAISLLEEDSSVDINTKVDITSDVFIDIEEYAQAGFKVGDSVTYLDLLYGILLPSGADAVRAIVLNLTDSEEEFIDLMNKKVKELNLTNTHFDNAIGMDSDDNYSTASDMATILNYALSNDTFKKIFTTRTYSIEELNLELNSTLVNYGKSLDVSNITGAKSGFTDGAGLCLASTFSYDGVDYLLVVLGSDTSIKSSAVKDSLTIYDYFKDNYSYVTIIEEDTIIKNISIKYGKTNEYKLTSDKDYKMYLNKEINIDDLVYDYDGIEELTYKNKLGDKLGVVSISYNDNVIAVLDIYLNEDIDYYHPFIYLVMIIAILLMILSLLSMKKKKKHKKHKRKRK